MFFSSLLGAPLLRELTDPGELCAGDGILQRRPSGLVGDTGRDKSTIGERSPWAARGLWADDVDLVKGKPYGAKRCGELRVREANRGPNADCIVVDGASNAVEPCPLNAAA